MVAQLENNLARHTDDFCSPNSVMKSLFSVRYLSGLAIIVEINMISLLY